MTNDLKLREEWLRKVADRMTSKIEEATGQKLPPYRVACGFPSKMAIPGKKGYRRGECWSAIASKDGHAEIFLSPLVDETETVAAILAHELIHACLPLAGHKRPFQIAATKIGHVKPFTTACPTDDFWNWVRPILEDVGPYPHAALQPREAVGAPKKQKNRMIKCECAECGYTARVAKKWLDLGAPVCGVDHDHGPMQYERQEDEDEVDLEDAA